MIQAARAQVAELTQAAYERAAAAGVLTGGAEVKATVEIPKDTAHGDYASSFAMAGARALHMAPRAIAQAIVDHMDLTGSYFQKVDIAGPGFLNFTLGPKWYGQGLAQVEQEGPPLSHPTLFLLSNGKGTPLTGDAWRACGQHYLSALPVSSLRTFDLPHDLYRRRPKELTDTIHRFLLEHL
mgnify:CR=1 FL=1